MKQTVTATGNGLTAMRIGTNLEVSYLPDGRIAVILDPKVRGNRSASGKTVIVASSHGNQTVSDGNGGVVTLGINAYIKAA
jgi:hypothetical protein